MLPEMSNSMCACVGGGASACVSVTGTEYHAASGDGAMASIGTQHLYE